MFIVSLVACREDFINSTISAPKTMNHVKRWPNKNTMIHYKTFKSQRKTLKLLGLLIKMGICNPRPADKCPYST